jgi:hypothetical protein
MYTLSMQVDSGRLAMARIPFGASPERVAKAWDKAIVNANRLPRMEEQFKPADEPFLSEWLALHRQHKKALRDGKKNVLRLIDAVRLADEKYAVYLRWFKHVMARP